MYHADEEINISSTCSTLALPTWLYGYGSANPHSANCFKQTCRKVCRSFFFFLSFLFIQHMHTVYTIQKYKSSERTSSLNSLSVLLLILSLLVGHGLSLKDGFVPEVEPSFSSSFPLHRELKTDSNSLPVHTQKKPNGV